MAELKLELLGSPLLREKAVEVGEIDDALRRLVKDMFETMRVAEGIGLAGPQVGVLKRIVVIDLNDDEHAPMVLINPSIRETGRESEKVEEGCLSIPGVAALVERPIRVVAEWLDIDGKPVRMEADGLLARCLQHEIDHLDGVLFIDYLSALKRSMVVKKFKQLQAAEEAEAKKEKQAARRRG